MELVAALVRIQQKSGKTDAAFSAMLGIPRSTWQYYKSGGTLSLRFVQSAARAFPQVRRQVERLIFGTDANNGSKSRIARQKTA